MPQLERVANPDRGEVELVVDGSRYVLRLRTNAICAMQNRLKKSYGDILQDLTKVDYADLRELLFSALQPYHGSQFKTLESVGDLMDDAGGHNGIIDVVVALFNLNRPPAKKDIQAGGAANPPSAQAGTGIDSGLTPGVPA
jgi:hypothetical protein